MDWTAIYYPILGAIGTALAGIVTGYATKWLKTHTGIELDQNQQAQAKQIVQSVEEKAANLAKSYLQKPSGPAKHADAVSQLQTLNPAMTQDQAVKQVDRAVGSLPNVGATAECIPVKINPNMPAG